MASLSTHARLVNAQRSLACVRRAKMSCTQAVADFFRLFSTFVFLFLCVGGIVGYTSTEMTSFKGEKSCSDAAKTPTMLALSPEVNSSGGFWRDEHLSNW